MVLDYIDNSLRYVNHERRKEISLGDYLRRHHYMNASALKEFSNDLLKSMVQKALG